MGAVARLLLPGRQKIGLLWTLLVGLIGLGAGVVLVGVLLLVATLVGLLL